MREWFWRVLSSAGAGFVGGPLWPFIPPNIDSSFADVSLDARARDAPVAPTATTTRRRRRNQPGIAQECEAFLAGRYRELAPEGDWRALPASAWINPLAHAELSELERLVQLSPSRHDPLAFLSYLADEVLLRVGGNDMTLKRIQHDALVPLELALLHQRNSCNLLTVARIIRDQLEHLAAP